jgi:hypothetical protein
MGFLGLARRKKDKDQEESPKKKRKLFKFKSKANIPSNNTMVVDILQDDSLENEIRKTSDIPSPRRQNALSSIPNMKSIELVSTVQEAFVAPEPKEDEEIFEQSFPAFTVDDNLYASSMMTNFALIEHNNFMKVEEETVDDESTEQEPPLPPTIEIPEPRSPVIIEEVKEEIQEVQNVQEAEKIQEKLVIQVMKEEEDAKTEIESPDVSLTLSPIRVLQDMDSSSLSLSPSMSEISISEGTPTHYRSRSLQRAPSPALDSPTERLRKFPHRRQASDILKSTKTRPSEIVEFDALRKYKRTMDRLEGLPDVLYTKSLELLCDGWMCKKTDLEQSKKEVKLGLRYLKASADLGCIQAQLDYAEMLVKHSNDKRNKEAITYLQMATENGSKKAKIILSKLYEYYDL